MNIYSCCVLLLPSAACFTQSQRTPDTLKPEDIEIITSYEPVIHDAFKIQQTPSVIDTAPPKIDSKYALLHRHVQTNFQTEPIAPALMKGEPLDKLYKSHIKGGIGNYFTSFLDASFNNTRSRDYSYGARLRHHGSLGTVQDKNYATFNDNNASIYGKKFLPNHLISGEANYRYYLMHYYGYDPYTYGEITAKDVRQYYSRFSANAQLVSFFTDTTVINYDAQLHYYNTSDRYGVQENNIIADDKFSRYFGSQLVRLSASYDFNRFSGSTSSYSSGILKLHPQIVADGKKWRLNFGLAIYMDDDFMLKKVRFFFKPITEFKYNVISNIIVPYLGTGGYIRRNSFRSFSDENPFVTTIIPLVNTDEKYELYGGVRGSVSSNITFNVRASQAQYNLLPLYVNDATTIPDNRFTVVYDTVKINTFSGELAYQKTEKLRFILKGDYYNYSLLNEIKAWHRPDYKVTFTGVYDLKDKIVLRADIYGISKQYAKEYEVVPAQPLTVKVVVPKELRGTTDINFGAEYRYNTRLSAFLQLNNMLGIRYYRWNDYPVQGFNVLIGGSYSF